jgi:hypothetical protein
LGIFIFEWTNSAKCVEVGIRKGVSNHYFVADIPGNQYVEAVRFVEDGVPTQSKLVLLSFSHPLKRRIYAYA